MKPVLFIAFAFVAISWQSVLAGDAKSLIVAPQQVPCSAGVARISCLQVKEKPTADWTLFYSPIEGFNYEPGYEYELKVQTEKIDNPPADSSSIKYTLLEQVSKTKM